MSAEQIRSRTPPWEVEAWEGEACEPTSHGGLDPIILERIWDGSARLCAERLGVSERTIVRWRNGHQLPRSEVDWVEVRRKAQVTRQRRAEERALEAEWDGRFSLSEWENGGAAPRCDNTPTLLTQPPDSTGKEG